MENVGRFEPGESYIYEKADGITYARKAGNPPDTRFEIGRDYDSEKLHKELMNAQLWGKIHCAAKSNPALQEALDRVIVIYELSRQEQTVDHHPV